MKIVMVHNRYAVPGRGSGEEVMFDAIADLLARRGNEVVTFMRSSLEIGTMRFGRTRAFMSGIYSARAAREMQEILSMHLPDVVFVQNVYPLFSPSVVAACRSFGIPVIMRCPNYRLVCPNGLFLSRGEVCERCSGGREYWCLLRNCERNVLKSAGYALRGFAARRLSLFRDNVDIFMVLTEFAKHKLVENGFDPGRIHVISGLADTNAAGAVTGEVNGDYVGYAGRVSAEKGVDVIVEAARKLPGIRFKVAGKYDEGSGVAQGLPGNVELLGQLNAGKLDMFYANARMVVIPSRWYEGLPAVAIETMLRGKPIVCSRIGGLPEVVEDGVTGLLFEPGDAVDLAEKVGSLWKDTGRCKSLGLAGRDRARKEYSPEAFYNRLMKACEAAGKLAHKKQSNASSKGTDGN
jgi:glycosyltransferase involved in cell wall biosynthesis